MHSHGALGKAPGWGPHDVPSLPQSPGLVFLGFPQCLAISCPSPPEGSQARCGQPRLALFKQKEKEGSPASGCGPSGCHGRRRGGSSAQWRWAHAAPAFLAFKSLLLGVLGYL